MATTWSTTDHAAGITVSGTSVSNTVTTDVSGRATTSSSGAKKYLEFTQSDINQPLVGFANASQSLTAILGAGSTFTAFGVRGDTGLRFSGTVNNDGTFPAGNRIAIAFDETVPAVWWRDVTASPRDAFGNLIWNPSGDPALGTGGFTSAVNGAFTSANFPGPYFPAYSFSVVSGDTVVGFFNSGAGGVLGPVPSGFETIDVTTVFQGLLLGIWGQAATFVTFDGSAPVENVGSVSSDGNAPVENAAAVRFDNGAAQIESLGSARSDGVAPAEFQGSARSDGGAPIEDLGSARSDGGAPIEDLGSARSDGAAPLEGSGSTRSDGGAPVESLGGARSDSGAPLENLGGQRNDGDAPIEFLGSTSTDGRAPVEVLASAATDGRSPVEFLGSSRSDGSAPIEVLGSMRSDGGAPLELLGAFRLDVRSPIEFLFAVRNDGSGQVEFLGSSRTDGAAPAEWSALLRLDHVATLEFLSATVVSSARALIEVLGGARIDASGQVEFSGSVSTDARALIEFISKTSNAVIFAQALRQFLIAYARPEKLVALARREDLVAEYDPGRKMDQAVKFQPPIVVGAEKTIGFDYGSVLSAGVTVVSAAITVTVSDETPEGTTDATPQSRAVGNPVIVASKYNGAASAQVNQLFGGNGLVPGVTYLILCLATTSDGQVLDIWRRWDCIQPS